MTALKALIVEDDSDTRDLLARFFSSRGHEPDCFDNAESGLGAFREEPYPLVILDWMLPGMTGVDMARLLRMRDDREDMHIMMITGQDSPGEIREAIAAGVDDYLTKPIDLRQLGVRLMLAEEKFQARPALRKRLREDPLTGLPNRHTFSARLNGAGRLARANPDYVFAVAAFELNRFKTINDTYGYETGDAILKAVAGRLQNRLGETDLPARLNGDQFALILGDVSSGPHAREILAEIYRDLSRPFLIFEQSISLKISMGVCYSSGDFDRPQDLLRDAEQAMARARSNGISHIEEFDDFMRIHRNIKVSLETALRRAMERLEFELHYQPIIDNAHGRMTGVEALLRWPHPEFGAISPAQFIPIAEETGMIMRIGEWALRTACEQNRAWQEEGLPPIYVSVNLSPRQFQDRNLFDMIQRVLEETGLGSECLVLEITESSTMEDMPYAVNVLNKFMNMGIRISLDDFGTGHSSLAYLKDLPIHNLKIDRSFIKDVAENPYSRAITEAILAMSRGLELNTIAEGVEDQEQLDFLKRNGCSHTQGYFLGRPMPAADITARLRDENSRSKPNNAGAGMSAFNESRTRFEDS